MKILIVNSVLGSGSIGHIVAQLQEKVVASGNNCVVAYSYRAPKDNLGEVYQINGWLDAHIHNRLASISGLHDTFSMLQTQKFIRFIKRYQPDLIHLHLIQDNYLNIRIFMSYLKTLKIPIVWTFHDVRAYTGGCPYYSMAHCQKWETDCQDCPSRTKGRLFDAEHFIYYRNKKLFTQLKNCHIVAPSQFYMNDVKHSFLKQYEVRTIYNGIDLSVFKPSFGNKRKELSLEGKKVILGVAASWNERKGLDVFVELAKRLDERFCIVLVGTSKEVDQQLPENIVSIHRTNSQKELAELYTMADVFVNPTREEVFGLVNVESLACGTPVIVYRTGGCPEIVDSTCGTVIDCDDVNGLEKEIRKYCDGYRPDSQACMLRAAEFSVEKMLSQYYDMYLELTNDKEKGH